MKGSKLVQLGAGWMLALLVSAGACAQALNPALTQQEVSRTFLEPPSLTPAASAGEAAPELPCPSSTATVNGSTVTVNLNVAYSKHKILNPNTGANDVVRLRSYNGCLVGPTIAVSPGDTLAVNVTNNLPSTTVDCPESINTPNCFNVINLHTHGLHVSPSGNSDNVFVSINPGSSFTYDYNIPANHPAGTFWFHPHHHGGVATSVSSGLEGVLIINGTRTYANRAQNGGMADIDTLLHNSSGQAFPDRVIMFQQIAYGCFSDAQDQDLETDSTGAWTCPSGSTGVIENYPAQFGVTFVNGAPESTWQVSQRYTTINGKVQPVMSATAGVIERWRMVHGGMRDTINVSIVKAAASSTLASGGASAAQVASRLQSMSPKAAAQVAARTCSGAPVSQFEIAVDGLTRAAASVKTDNIMNPGQRSDALVVFPTPGLYCVLDLEAPSQQTIVPTAQRKTKNRQLLALVAVSGGTRSPATAAWVGAELASANPTLPPAVRGRLRSLVLTDFTPPQYTDLSNATVTGGHPSAMFDLLPAQTQDNTPITNQPAQNTQVAAFLGAIQNDGIGAQPLSYSDTTSYVGTLGTIDEWKIGIYPGAPIVAPHVFHIHVNPFEIVDITDLSTGNSIFAPTGGCISSEASLVPMYCDLKGVFRDTMFVEPGYVITARTRYDDFTGEYVSHCHILDHEDQGMMMNITIVPANASPSLRAAALRGLTLCGLPGAEGVQLRDGGPDTSSRNLFLYGLAAALLCLAGAAAGWMRTGRLRT